MDRQRHRLLTENVSYFQKCLTVTRELLKMCVDEGVLGEEEEQTIWVRTRRPFSSRPTARLSIDVWAALSEGSHGNNPSVDRLTDTTCFCSLLPSYGENNMSTLVLG